MPSSRKSASTGLAGSITTQATTEVIKTVSRWKMLHSGYHIGKLFRYLKTLSGIEH